MAINILQGMAAFFGEPQTPALPFNGLVQLRIPGLDSTGEPASPDFTPRKITNFLDVVKQYNPGFKIELVDPDGNSVTHRLTYQNQKTVEEFFNKQFNPAYLVKNLQKACDGTETRSLLWEDLVRNASLLRAITHWGQIETQADVIRWLEKIPDDAANLENELNTIWDEKPALPFFKYSISEDTVLSLPHPNDCTQTQIDTLQREREARLARNRSNEDRTSLDLKEKISYLPWANNLAEIILRQSILGFLQNNPNKSQRTLNNFLDHLTQINQSINKRFLQNFRTAIDAQQSIERPLREIAGLFSEFENTVRKEREICEHAKIPYTAPTANIFLVNAHMLEAPNGEGVIINNNVLSGNHDELSTVDFRDVMKVSQHIALMVVSDRMRSTAGDVMMLAPKAKDISMIVVANIDSDALAWLFRNCRGINSF